MDYTVPTSSMTTKDLNEKMLESYQLRHDGCVATCRVIEYENEMRLAKAEATISSALKELAVAKNLAKGAQAKSKAIDTGALVFDPSISEGQRLLDDQHLQQRKAEKAVLEPNALMSARETAETRVQDARDRLVEVKAEALRKETDAKSVAKYVRDKVGDYMEKLLDLESRVDIPMSTATGITSVTKGTTTLSQRVARRHWTTPLPDRPIDQRRGKAEADLRSAQLAYEYHIESNPTAAAESKAEAEAAYKTFKEAVQAVREAEDQSKLTSAAHNSSGRVYVSCLAACDQTYKARCEMIEALRRHKSAAAKARECHNRPIILRCLVRSAEAKLLFSRY
ncbi:hypothetical protein HBH56_028660 [Parastagonospora nodorum]|uniref:Uncharacterized protein n=1 Tax=Phaeosphaeria nodorum (strain SN15 / ATCC MYA-4574 / FGSC 10173) TaxID=321614 RepID=A0A7U2F5J0_PHANO|nr:hypothetical protein HBH56_028660 [Parastagonospora nodorum]QRC99131.1 hypothetical protein JI435_064700 [Parastagonospora nodorum SN15]KAH3934224.1 hypothetical protein HBH54_053380 [Parastagonospora nodorum]KAH4141604.1 hypothetical protein HBH45_063410 [Parastagonospora nodorum]KAH4161812.1 hypothetical protein HBH44_097000 [Parastagonospora nodorum]